MRQGRLISTAVAALAALAIAPAAAWAAPSPVVDSDFAGGAPDTNTWVVEPGLLRLKPAVSANFEGTSLSAGWMSAPWPPTETGTASVEGGAVTVDGARVNTTAIPAGAGGVVEFRAAFTGARFQHVGFGNDFDQGPWAMFSTGAGGPGLLARTRTATGESSTDTPITIPGFDPTQRHVYRIEWTAGDVKFYVDGTLVPTPAAAITGDMRPVISDFDPAPVPPPVPAPAPDTVVVDWIARSPYPTSGIFESRMLEADDARAVWGSLTATPSTGVTFQTRTGNSAATMSAYEPLDSTGKVQSPPGKFIKYKATLATTDVNTTPSLDSVSISYEIDSNAPTTTIGGTGTTVTFSSPDSDVARFECSVDGGAFATCTSPQDYSGLAPGSHTVSVHAVDKAGNVGPAVSRTVTVAGPPGGGNPNPPGDDDIDDDTTAPEITLGSRKLRASVSGKVKLRLTCPDDEDSCEITVRLKRNGKTLAGKILTLSGGDTKKVTLKLSKKMRRKLAARGKLSAKAVISASDETGNQDRTKYSVTIRPR